MSDDYKFGLDDLQITDDLDVSMDNDTYRDQANPAPPVAGNYRVRAVSMVTAKYRQGERAGQPILENDKFPIFTIPQIEIVEGLGEGVTRKVGVFHDVKTKPFKRFDGTVSGLGDLTRSYGTRSWRGLDPENPDSGIAVLKEAVESQQLFTIQLDWNIYDKAFIEAARELLKDELGDREDRSDEQKKLMGAIYSAGRITGMKFFPYDADRERFSHVFVRGDVTFTNPVTKSPITVEVDHRAMEARPVISRFYPSKDYEAGRVKIGPLNVKPAALKLVA